MSRRKFNLGDILRKLNEESDSAADKDQAEKHAYGSGRLASGTIPAPQGPVNRPERSDGALPRQPVIGRFPAIEQMRQSDDETPAFNRTGTVRPEEPLPGHPSRKVNAQNEPATYPPPVVASSPRPAAPSPPVGAAEDEDDEEAAFDIYKYVGILLRRKYIVLIVAFAAAFFSLFKYLVSDSYYIAKARLLFRPDAPELVNDSRTFRYWGDREKLFSTHLELLQSQTVLLMVAENIGDGILPEKIAGGLKIAQGETDGEKNDIIELSFRNGDPEKARDVLNELCRTYIDYRRDVNAQEITRLVSKFEVQIGKVQEELSAKENTLRQFKENNRMVELSNETNLTISKLAELETSLQQTQLALLESKERLTALNTQIGRQEQDVVQSVTFHDPFRNRIGELELELNSLSSEYSTEHFKVKMLRQQIDNLKEAAADSMTREAASRTLVKNPIRQTLLQDLVNLTIQKSALEAKRMALEQLIERLNRDLIKLPSMEQRYAFLQRETESLLQTLRMLKTKYEEAKIRRDSQESDLKILELARTPKAAISSVNKNSIVIGILIGLILGIALALLIEYLDQSLKDPSTVEKSLGLPLLGIVPYIEADNALIEQFADLTKNILEPFRALRANLKHIAVANNLHVFIVCSAVKGEGKTTLAANLGITFAVDGKKVILVDADLRRSQAHTLFSIPKQTGLADYLMGAASIDDIIKPTRFENMSVITSGERPHNPAELLGTVLFDRLIAELRSKADIVIFDSPALLPVSDTITMAPKMDGVLFVVRTFWTPMKAAKQALNQLQRIGSRMYGGILNGASHSGKYYPYYYGYYGYYGYSSYKYSYEDDHNQHKKMSVRRVGLHIEKTAKERLSSLRFTVPKLADAVNRGIVRLAHRRTFWLLVAVLFGITGARIVLLSKNTEPAEDSVVYLGFGMDKLSGETEFADAGTGRDMAFTGGIPLSDTGGAAIENGNGPSEPSVVNDTALVESVNNWLDAFRRKDTAAYLSFYRRELFRFEGGGFAGWVDKCRDMFSVKFGKYQLLTSGLVMTPRDSVTVEVYADFMAVNSIGTLKGRTAALWVKNSAGWRIIRQKSLPQDAKRKKDGPDDER